MSETRRDLNRYGPRVANRIRLFLAFSYYASVFTTIKTTPPIQTQIYLVGISIMLGYCILHFILDRLDKVHHVIPPLFLILDAAVLTGTMVAGVVNGAEAAVLVLRTTVLYQIFAIYIACAALARFSTRFVLWLGLTSCLGATLALVCAVIFGGLTLTNDIASAQLPGHSSFGTEILKIVFIFVFTLVVRSVLVILISLRKEAERQRAQVSETNHQLKLQANTMSVHVDTLKMSLSQIRSLVTNFNQRLENQASSLEEIAATMEEFSASIQHSTDSVTMQYGRIDSMNRQSSDLERMIQTVSTATRGLGEKMGTARETGQEATRAVEDLFEILRSVRDSFNRVSDVNQMMAEIADHTNLLALNAAIEAARAGEYGRGFAIVAQEVGKLAGTSATNANVIESIIGESGRLIENGRRAAETANRLVQDQSKGFGQIIGNFADLEQSIREQQKINVGLIESLKELKQVSAEIERISKEQQSGSAAVVQLLSSLESDLTAQVAQSRQMEEGIIEIDSQAESLRASKAGLVS